MRDRTLRPVGLIVLRVFSLGRRTETLLERVAKPWRYVGGIQLITGPDLARTTVQPHQFLDFLAGRLHRPRAPLTPCKTRPCVRHGDGVETPWRAPS